MSRRPSNNQPPSKPDPKEVRRELREASSRLSEFDEGQQREFRQMLNDSRRDLNHWTRSTSFVRGLTELNQTMAAANNDAYARARNVANEVLTRSEELRRLNAQAANAPPGPPAPPAAPPRMPTPPPAPPQQHPSVQISRHIQPWRDLQRSADSEYSFAPRGASTLPRDHHRPQPTLDYSFDPPRAPSGDYNRGGLAPPTRRVASSSQPDFGSSQPPFRQMHRPQISAVGGRPASVRSHYSNAPSTTSSGSTGTLYVHSSDESHQSHRSPQPNHPQASGHSHPSHQSTHAAGTHASSSHGAGPSHASRDSSHRHSGTSRRSSGH